MTSEAVALATCSAFPDLYPDDQLLLPELRARGWEPRGLVWDDPAARWESFKTVVIRSCWDYHLKLPAFLEWLARLERGGARVLNPPAMIRRNADKRYLLELEARGAAVVPTLWLERGSRASLASILGDRGWERAVIKPAVSANGHRTSIATRDDQALFDSLLHDADVLVQPFLQEIVTEGEWSFLFFGGSFSHALIKKAAGSEFRVQATYGGTADRVEPPNDLVRQAAELCRLGAPGSTYARVDGVVRDGALVLMELELIEPFLFLGLDPGAPARFADALVTSTKLDRADRPASPRPHG